METGQVSKNIQNLHLLINLMEMGRMNEVSQLEICSTWANFDL
jgi:hypothetical protein